MVDAVNDKPVSFSKETDRINDLKINFQSPKKEQSARKCPYFISIVLNNVSINMLAIISSFHKAHIYLKYFTGSRLNNTRFSMQLLLGETEKL